MKNLMRKIGAVVLMLAMVLTMCFSVLGAALTPETNSDGKIGTEDDFGTITVSGVTYEGNLKVRAYPIIEALYDSNGNFNGYKTKYPAVISQEKVDSLMNSNLDDPDVNKSITEAELNEIIASLGTDTGYFEMTASGTSGNVNYSASVDIGSYLVMLTDAEAKIYSPVVISTQYKNVSGVNAIDNGTVTIQNGNAWVKVSDKPEIVKKVNGVKENSVDDVLDILTYTIEVGPVPYYGGDYPVFNVVDTMGAGISYYTDGTTYVPKFEYTKDNGESYTALPTTKYIYTAPSSTKPQELSVNFVDEEGEYLLNNPEYIGSTIKITYYAKLNENAVTNDLSNDNNVVLNYSKDSKIVNKTGTIPDKTKTYTYELSVKKTGVGSSKIYLPGAKFKLYTNSAANTLYDPEGKNLEYQDCLDDDGYLVSDDDGKIEIRGLGSGAKTGSAGETRYYLKEEIAPEGYSVNTHPYEITITDTYNSTGVRTGWNIAIDTDEDVKDGEYEIPNTKLSALPSTGGMGTYLFTIIGVAVMATMAFFFFRGRKVEEE